MTEDEFDAAVASDIRRLVDKHLPPGILERCAYCAGWGRVAVPVAGAVLWPTQRCAVCGGSGAIVVEA